MLQCLRIYPCRDRTMLGAVVRLVIQVRVRLLQTVRLLGIDLRSSRLSPSDPCLPVIGFDELEELHWLRQLSAMASVHDGRECSEEFFLRCHDA